MKRFRDIVTSLDWIILVAAALLVLTGLAMFFSATYTEGPVSPLFVRQAIVAAVGFCLTIFLSQIPYHTLKRYSIWLYAIGVISLVFVSVSGRIIRGTISRLELLGFQLQPSEFVKIALIVALAALLAKSARRPTWLLIRSAVVIGIPLSLVASEPDIGMSALYTAIWIGCLIFWGLPWKHMAIIAAVGAVVTLGAWQFVLLDYQKARITNFLNPTADPLGSGYNVSQSIVALGSGKLFGRGLGHGPQSQLKFLPERHTDFILASIGEELGFIGVALIISLYAILLWRIIKVAHNTTDPFGQLIAIGTFWTLFAGFIVSVGMNMGVLPVTGIPLSLVSYGGSNLLATCILLGLVESVQVNSRFRRSAPLELSELT